MKPASGLVPSQSRKWTYQAVAKTKQRPMFNCCSALFTAMNYAQIPWTFKGLWITDVPVSFCWHSLNFQRTCLPQIVSPSSDLTLCHDYYYSNTATNRKPQCKQCSSSQSGQRIMYGNVYLCNTHNSMCDHRAGARSPNTQHGSLQPVEAIIMTILLWKRLKGRWCQAHTMLSSSHGWQEGHNLSATHLA